MSGFFSKARILAEPGFNRWRIPPASVAIHLCIGSVYAWSIFNPPLMRLKGVVASAPGDWSLSQVTGIYMVAIAVLGLAAAFAGRWMEQVGPRTVGIVAGVCWGAGFLVGWAGIHWHQLWLLYLGYGVIGGCGLGLGYVSPVSTLIRWFPDRRGMATGMAIMGFGGGAVIAAPLNEYLIHRFSQQPRYLGALETVPLITKSGKRFATQEGRTREVVVVGANEATKDVRPGVYLAGTGRAGIAEAFLVLGAGYFLVILIAASTYRLPAPGWKPAGWSPPDAQSPERQMITRRNVGINEALLTPQFYLLWVMLCLNVTAGIGVLGVAKTMITEIFGTTLPRIVDSRFAAMYVLMMSLFNMAGRFFWASVSDYLGRKTTYTIFFSCGMLLYCSVPFAAYQVSVSPHVTWLICFYAATMLIFTMYGGGFATIPAYLADLFGTRFVGGIHGRLLTAWSTAGVAGPLVITALREASLRRAIDNLAHTVDPAKFSAAFGAPLTELNQLVAQKTVTIAKLMEIAPPGIVNPSSTLYNTTMYLMAGLLGIALIANWCVRPVDPRHYLEDDAAG